MTRPLLPTPLDPSAGYVFERHAHNRLLAALGDTRVVVLLGARQVGKSTLARVVASQVGGMEYVSLDDRTLRAAADADPKGFLSGLRRPTLIDEIQRVPDLLLEIKGIVDTDRSPGQFLLTGSANILTAPKIKDALTGRAEYLTLWPLAQAEIAAARANFVDAAFAGALPHVTGAPVGRAAFAGLAASGGYPEARLREPDRRKVWFRDYIRSVVDRDLRDISDATKLDQIPRLLRLIASQAANLWVPSSVSSKLKLDSKTVASYTQLLETLFIVRRLQAWAPGIGSREIQHEKIYVTDTGLMAHLVGADEERIRRDDQVTGRILENFVAMEIMRLADASAAQPRQYHYRQESGRDEVDVVLENDTGELVAFEVKASATVVPSDYRALEKLRQARGSDFRAGAVFFTGPGTVPLGDRLWALPISTLWS